MTKREVVCAALNGEPVPYTPWSFSFTKEAKEKLLTHFGTETELNETLDNHLYFLGNQFFDDIGNDCVKDYFGVIWNRSIDKDIGIVKEQVLPEPTLDNYNFPDPRSERLFSCIEQQIAKNQDCLLVYPIGFSLYERAWTLRGMPELLMDFYDAPNFVHELFSRIVDFNISQVEEALKYDIDGIYFGDDWGQQHGLIMGYDLWKEFIYPQLRRMYGIVKKHGKKVFIHSCGDVDELFDDLIDAGLDCFNPFQPEVMDVHALLDHYRGRLAFHGGLSTQQTLPYSSVKEVKAESERLLHAGLNGGYIFSPAHAVEDDVPLENMLAFIECAKKQPGYCNRI